ncbi:MAG: hypothetical protein KJ587_13675 [Alphaproteobacteria bacterium]|nr:hypothetical protein [Alphaproteobacteria bacterium]
MAKIIKVECWPAVDRLKWQDAQRPRTLLEQTSSCNNWRPQTFLTVAAGYGRWLGWLQENGLFDARLSPEERCTPDVVAAYIKDLRATNRPKTVLSRILNLERALSVLAPASDRSFLRSIIKNLSEGHGKAGKRSRLREPAQLVELGFELMAKARAGIHTSVRKNASVYRDGLQIALLATRPFRLKNFNRLELHHDLVFTDKNWRFLIPKEDVKNWRDIDVHFPPDLASCFTEYLELWRPLLAGLKYDGDRLWVSYFGKPQSKSGMHQQIAHRTEAAFGRRLCPQLFRDCVATSLAVHEPEIVTVASAILGNSIEVCQRYYNQAQTLEAGRALSNTIFMFPRSIREE